MRFTTKYSFFFSCIIVILLYDTDKTLASAPPSCTFKCRGQGSSLVKLEEGVTYTYNLEGLTETSLPKSKGVYGNSVNLNIRAKAEVSYLGQCKTIIQLRDVQINGPDGKTHQGLAKLEQYPLAVSLHGGKLDTEVCATHDDDFASLNIKRAVASLLQANTGENGGSGVENDVFGSCHTNFKVTKDSDAIIVTKHRDLERCQFRENLRQSLFSMAHGHTADIQSSPLVSSNYEVEQKIRNGILESAAAKEEYLFRPFSNRESGARTKVITRLVLESKNPAAPPALPVNEPRSIFFENPHETVTCSIQTIMAALHKVADVADGAVPTSAAREFSSLVRLMRRASKEDLLSVYGNCKAGAGFPNRLLAKKAFTDALFQAGSADSVAAAVELLKSNEIADNMAKYWYLSFAFVRHTSASTLASAMTLLDNPQVPHEAYLGIGALAGHYCREHKCDGVPKVDQLLAKFTEIIGTPAKISRDRENYVIAALKGLKNIKHLNEETANKITHVMKDGHVSSRIRVAALETAHSDACRGKLQKGASDIFYNREEDSELRIKAYLVLVECATPKFANKLSEFMETEPVNQVGAFVTSHLRNLRSSSNPDKENIRHVLYNVKPRRKFPFDIRKFSRNHEFSYNLDALSTSAAAESNVIFSQKSFLPRSVNLNLTVEVFGHAFNLFEVSGRAENLERIYERYFGPKGYFNTHKPLEIVKEARHAFKEIEARIDEKYKNMIHRGRRSVSKQDTKRFASKVKLFNSKLDNNIDVDLSMKVLGNELSWVNIEDIETPITPSALIDKVATFLENGIGSARDFRKDLKNHYHFLDTEVAYPTSAGLPLRLNAIGSGIVYLKLGGNVDASAFLKDPKNGYAKFEVIPSASIEIAGEFGIDGYAVEAGIKLAGNLHTATGTEITLQMLNGQGIDINVGLPVKKSDVITVNTEVFSFAREQGLPSTDNKLEFSVPRKEYHGCFDQLQALVGLTFCGDLAFPNDQKAIISTAAMYPLNGHSILSFRLDKEDDSLTSYHARLFFDINNPKNRRVEFKIDTPGTQRPREVSFLASVVTEPDKAIDVHFVSPIHEFIARGAIIDNDSEYSISGYVKFDDVQEYKARLGFLNNGASYTPILEFSPAGGALADVKVTGEVFVEKRQGNLRRFDFRGVQLKSDKMNIRVDGSIGTGDHSFQSDLHVGYDQHTVGVKTDFHTAGGRNFKMNVEITPSQYPDFNFGVKYEYESHEHHLENNLVFVHGKDLASSKNKLSVFQQLDYRYESLQNFDVATKNVISYPLLEIEGKVEGAATRKSINYNIEGTYGKYVAKSALNAKTHIRDFGDYEIDFSVFAFDKSLSLQAKREIVDPHKSRFTQKLDVSPGKSYELSAEVNHHFANNEVKLSVIATSLNYPNHALNAELLTTPALFDGNVKIHDGSKNTLEGILKFSRIAPFFGNFKFFAENHVDSHGEYQFEESKVTGVLSAHFVDVNTMIKGTANLMKNGNKYTGVIEAQSEHNGQPRWRLNIDTDTDVDTKSINSRNKVALTNKVLELNFHGLSEGKNWDGTVSGGFDVTMPDGKFYVASVKHVNRVFPRDASGQLVGEIGTADQKGGPLSKIFFDFMLEHFDSKKFTGVSKVELGKEGPAGNARFFYNFKNIPQEGKNIFDEEISITGSLVKIPFESKGSGFVSKAELSFDSNTILGDYHLKSRGKINTGIEDKIRHYEYFAEINTPHEPARRIVLEHLVHFAQGDESRPHMLQVKEEYTLNDKMFKLNGEASVSVKQGNVKGSLLLPGENKPSNLDLTYKRDIVNDLHKAEVALSANFDNDGSVHMNSVFDYRTDLDVVNGHINGQTSLQSLKNVDLQFSHKKLSNTARNTDFKLMLNGENVEGYSKVDLTPRQPLIDITATSSAGKSRFYYKLNRKSDRQAVSEGQVAWTVNGGGQLDFSTNVDIESYDNFHVLVKANSEKLHLNKVKVEVGNKAVKSGAAKKINFTAQTADKKGFSGSVTYAVKETDVGFTVEGKGNIEFQNEKHPLTYKAQYTSLSKAADNETGTRFTLNADFERGNFLVEHKLTDREFFYVSKFCKDGNCAHFEALNKLQIMDYTEMTHDASLIYKNTMEGRNDEFKTFSKTHRNGLIVNHESGVKLHDRHYNLKYYVNEQEGGLVAVLPHREIAVIAKYNLPLDLSTGKPKADLKHIQLHFDGSLYLDRINKPAERGNLLISGDLLVDHNLINSNAELKVSHPAMQKDFVIRGKGNAGLDERLVDASVEIEFSSRKNQRIAAVLTVDYIRTGGGRNITGNAGLLCKGMNLDIGTTGHLFVNEKTLSAASFAYYHNQNVKKETGIAFEASPERLFAFVKTPHRELLKVDSVISGSPEHQVMDIDVNLAELRHYTGKIETMGSHSMKTSIGCREHPDKKLEVSASVTPMLLTFKTEALEGPARENLLLLTLTSSKNHEEKPNFEINSEKIKHIMHELKTNARELTQQFRTLLTDLSKQSVDEYTTMIKGMKRVQPDFKPLLQYYQQEFDAIRNELAEDPQFQKLSSVLKNIFGGVIESLEATNKKIISIYEKMSHEATELQGKLSELSKEVFSRLAEYQEKISEPIMPLINKICDTGCALTGYALDFLKDHEPEIRQLLIVVSNYIQEFAEICTSITDQVRHQAEDFYRLIVEQVKTMPIYTNFQEKLKEVSNVELPQTLKNFYSEFTFALEDMMKTPELKEFSENFLGYLIKLPIPSIFVKLPRIGAFRELTIIRYLKSLNELPTLTEHYYAYRPFFNVLDNIPPFKAYGIILNSHHFFTFDQRHFAFKGSCSYVLAQDFLDGNFSIIANIENGVIKSITLSDQQDTVEMFNDRTVAVNGQHGDYPVNHNQFSGWVRYGTFNMKHKSGVFITKYNKQDIYLIRVNGFYFGRTRGLLGTISNEHFDDYILPNGHIAKDVTEFANAYKLMDACPAGTEYPPPQGHVQECTQIFSSDSELQAGFNLINPEIYREACDQHVGNAPSDKLAKSCDVASAYVLALKQGYMPYASLPDNCVYCDINGQPTNFGHRVDVRSPEGKADVVIVFEQSAFNGGIFRDLVTPLIGSLSHDLREKGLGDVEFALIGYNGPDHEWPQHFGNNGKITYEGKSDKIKFKETDETKPPTNDWEKRLNCFIKYINTELGREPIVEAMQEANIYPFRQGASKIILLVNSRSCPLSPTFPFSLQVPRIFSIKKYYNDLGLQFHIITPMPKVMSLTNKPDSELKNVVGFDAKKIYTFADAKKSDIEGDATDRPHLILENDLCVSFAQNHGGAAFNSNVFAHAKPEQQKKFVHVVSRRIAKGAIEKHFTESCTCKLYHGIFSYPECKVIS